MKDFSKFCIGTVQFGIPYGVNKNNSKLIKKSDVEKIFDFFYSKGGEFIDTAASYGRSERVISEFILPNSKVITKVELKKNLDLTKIQIEKSLNNLNLSNINTLLIHNVDSIKFANFFDLISNLKSEFNIDNIGISIYSPNDILDCAHNLNDFRNIDVIQAPYNVFDKRLCSSSLFSFIQDNNIRLDIRSIFLQGALLSKKNSKLLLSENAKYLDSWFNYLKLNKLKPLEGIFSNLDIPDKCLTIFGCNSLSEIKDIHNSINAFSDTKFIDNLLIPSTVIDPRLWSD
tara:strand:+ start:1925 stop:2785 length:861 start_codon:yes stop_codon:yes gene_type:complete